MATYNQSMAVKQFIETTFGIVGAGINIANVTNVLTYTCPTNVLWARVWPVAYKYVAVDATNLTLTLKTNRPSINGALDYQETLCNIQSQGGGAQTKNLREFLERDLFDLGTYTLFASAALPLATMRSTVLFPNEQLVYDVVDQGGSVRGDELIQLRYRVMEVYK